MKTIEAAVASKRELYTITKQIFNDNLENWPSFKILHIICFKKDNILTF